MPVVREIPVFPFEVAVTCVVLLRQETVGIGQSAGVARGAYTRTGSVIEAGCREGNMK